MYHGESFSIIEGLFNITYVRNTGVAFGIGATFHSTIKQIFFLGVPVIACLLLIVLIIRGAKLSQSLLPLSAYSLILAGAVGNLIDRFYFGFVTDFLDFHFRNSHFPAFNVADSSITVAAGLLIVDLIYESSRPRG